MGCPETCVGYELSEDLDFDTNKDGEINSSDDYWNRGSGWEPIGTDLRKFAADFRGNGNSISRLFINRSSSNVGLFGSTAESSRIENLEILSANVAGLSRVGILAGSSGGKVVGVRSAGRVRGNFTVGGLVGAGSGEIASSSSSAAVTGTGSAAPWRGRGGLAGVMNGGSIAASYCDRVSQF